MKLFNVLLISILFLLVLCGCVSAAVVNSENAESSLGSYLYKDNPGNVWNSQQSSNYYVSPSHAWRIELRKGEPEHNGGTRSELASWDEAPLQERWYNFSVYLPKGGDEDYAHDNHNCGEVIMQWHNNPDKGEEWTIPALSIITDTARDSDTGTYYLCSMYDNDPISTTDKIMNEGKYKEYPLGSYDGDKGRWVQWAFHVKWGWLQEHNAFIRLYKDGQLVFSKDGPDTTNDLKGVNQQFGIYKWEWNGKYSDQNSKLSKRVIYFDDVSVSDAEGSGSSIPIPTPTPTPQPISYKPIANFTVSAASGKVPLTVKFTDKSVNTTGYKWNFDDGTTTKVQSPVHTFLRAGTYTVSLKAINSYGTSYKTVKIQVSPKNRHVSWGR